MIEYDKPVPPAKTWGNRKYPFAEMEVGGSVFVDECVLRVRAAANIYGRRKSKKFRTKTEGRGARVWRIE